MERLKEATDVATKSEVVTKENLNYGEFDSVTMTGPLITHEIRNSSIEKYEKRVLLR